jgi:hypothetical protein
LPTPNTRPSLMLVCCCGPAPPCCAPFSFRGSALFPCPCPCCPCPCHCRSLGEEPEDFFEETDHAAGAAGADGGYGEDDELGLEMSEITSSPYDGGADVADTDV